MRRDRRPYYLALEITKRFESALFIQPDEPAVADNIGWLSELNETSSYKRVAFIEEGGWATMPGGDKGDKDVARACAEMITQLGES